MYDFTKISSISLSNASNSVTSYKPRRTSSSEPRKFLNKFWEEIKLTETNEKLMLLAGDYESLVDGKKKQWKEKLIHETLYIPGKAQAFINCSAGTDSHNKKNCVGCVLFERGPKRDNPWYPKARVIFNAVSLAPYHDNVPYINKEGKTQTSKEGTPILIKQKCSGKGCISCKNYGKPAMFGRLMKLMLTGTQFSQLMNHNDKISKICAGCGFSIVVNNYSCGSCDAELLDVASNTYPEEYLATFSSNPQKCGVCTTTNFPRPGLDCGYDEMGLEKINEECPLELPVPLNIFTSILDITKKDKVLSIKETSIMDEALSKIKYTLPGKANIKDVVESAIKANGGKLFDLDTEVVMLNHEEQAKVLGVEDPCEDSKEEIHTASAIPQRPNNIPLMIRN